MRIESGRREDGPGNLGGMKARQVAVPEVVGALDTLARPNYTYACQVTAAAADDHSAEQWARAIFEGAPRLMRWLIVMGWKVGLGLRLGPRRSPSHVLGWTILSTTPTAVILGVQSFVLTAHLVVRVQDSKVVHATFVRYERALARVLWAAAAPIHSRVIPYLLNHAAAGTS
ncbi:MAG: hypothetical protein JWP02_1937 [Acidimicrobiales bacterium]|nr:hypothetical protein [Acidimicrobiales bacterium]